MRKIASVFSAAFFVANVPFGLSAETTYTNNGIYDNSAQSQFYNEYVPSPAYGYVDSVGIEETANVYALQETAYQAYEETPVAYEAGFGSSYETGLPTDQSGNTIISETIDGIVYETIISGDLVAPVGVEVFQTY